MKVADLIFSPELIWIGGTLVLSLVIVLGTEWMRSLPWKQAEHGENPWLGPRRRD
jgi:hypothetical protein